MPDKKKRPMTVKRARKVLIELAQRSIQREYIPQANMYRWGGLKNSMTEKAAKVVDDFEEAKAIIEGLDCQGGTQ